MLYNQFKEGGQGMEILFRCYSNRKFYCGFIFIIYYFNVIKVQVKNVKLILAALLVLYTQLL